jgi:hypothetical protein
MFHPVGPQPPSVYWRRRLVLLTAGIALLVLLAMTIKVIASSGGGSASAAGTPTDVAKTSGATSVPPSTSPPSSRVSSSAPSHSLAGSSTQSALSTTAAPRCPVAQLGVVAVTGQPNYRVGDQPLLELQVTNTGTAPCVQDLADRQVELRVYNGESRVWGSHDCKVEPGSDDRTLAPNTPVRVAITWSGLSSRPGCAGTRLRVGAGTYTLYAVLSGKTGKAAQFTIS